MNLATKQLHKQNKLAQKIYMNAVRASFTFSKFISGFDEFWRNFIVH